MLSSGPTRYCDRAITCVPKLRASFGYSATGYCGYQRSRTALDQDSCGKQTANLSKISGPDYVRGKPRLGVIKMTLKRERVAELYRKLTKISAAKGHPELAS